ncbi:spore coat U domain-containing protein [Luteimonas sp. S4-F44]|uniref:Csu type fimbrial protein n=1 Tax=Luteimonas sp. S4-F44 TaxID=2925842 RepID=UPI001F536DC5|nr:spore coat U domain-containing protein [Luteimonas sp. S4-F44]UNK41422.1 spore coat U domain-containing protein [Luteimonas sp. S4-F44]
MARTRAHRPHAPRPVGARVAGSLLAVLLTTSSYGLQAETQTTFPVSATVVRGCAIDGLGSSGAAGVMATLDFGTDSALSSAVRTADAGAAQVVTLRCTPGVVMRMRIDGGAHAAGGVRQLRHASVDRRLPYRLYRDPAFAQEIAIDQAQAITVPGTGALGIVLPVHARLALPGNALPGAYTDTVTVTLDW